MNKLLLLLFICITQAAYAQVNDVLPRNPTAITTLTYLLAQPNERENLKTFIRQNWLVMDSVAKSKGLLSSYELLENTETDSTQWDLIVAVGYPTAQGYAAMATQFEEIRKAHKKVLIGGKDFKTLGKVLYTHTVRQVR